ncbi:MAG TPA: outer membrane beta-barrel protein [Candidatus Angelobacter sp.]
MNSFTRGLFALTLGMALICTAHAQNFNGAYIGGYAGGNQGNSDAHTFTVFSSSGYFATSSVPAIAAAGNQNMTPSGFSGGGTAGLNLQHKSLVYGGEMDFGSMSMSASAVTGPVQYPCCPPTPTSPNNFTVTQNISTDWLFTGRGRLGFATGRMLIYGTGGLAAASFNYQALFTDTFAAAHESGGVNQKRKGFIGGGGSEFRMGRHWSLKGEFLFADFFQGQAVSLNLAAFTAPTPFPTNAFTHKADLNAKIFRSGFNYHF